MNTTYPLIPIYCAYMGSFSYYAADEKRRAKERNAPWDCITANDPNGGFTTLRDCKPGSPFREYLERNHPEYLIEF